MKHDFNGGKYTVVFNEMTGDMHAERHGDRWRSLTGDGMVLSMLQSTDTERALLDRAFTLLERLVARIDDQLDEGAIALRAETERLLRDMLNNAEDQTGHKP